MEPPARRPFSASRPGRRPFARQEPDQDREVYPFDGQPPRTARHGRFETATTLAGRGVETLSNARAFAAPLPRGDAAPGGRGVFSQKTGYSPTGLPASLEGAPRRAGGPSRVFPVFLLCAVLFGCAAYYFKDSLPELAALVTAKLPGKNARIAGVMPRAATDADKSPSSREEFVAFCATADPKDALKLLKDNPAWIPADAGGKTLLLALAERPAAHRVLIRLVLAGQGALLPFVNTADAAGRTPLHAAAENPDPSVLLALRMAGADPCLRNGRGETPLSILLRLPRDVIRKSTERAAEQGLKLGFTRYDPLAKKSRFYPIAGMADGPEQKAYFAILAAALNSLGKNGVQDDPVAPGDLPSPPPSSGQKAMENANRAPQGSGLPTGERAPRPEPWQAIDPSPDAGALAALIKCLLPEARPASVNWLSAPQEKRAATPPPLDAEWAAWNLPPSVRVYIFMEALRQRAGKTESAGTAGREEIPRQRGTEVAREDLLRFNSDSQKRNPLLMAWQLLDIAPKESLRQLSASPGTENRPEAGAGVKPDGRPGAGTGVKPAGRTPEQTLALLRLSLPDKAWHRAGRHLAAAAYVADAREHRMSDRKPPDRFLDNNSYEPLRLWGASPLLKKPDVPADGENAAPRRGRLPDSSSPATLAQPSPDAGAASPARTSPARESKDPGEPLVAVAAVLKGLSAETAKTMVELMLASGADPAQADQNGTLPLEAARNAGAAKEVLMLLKSK